MRGVLAAALRRLAHRLEPMPRCSHYYHYSAGRTYELDGSTIRDELLRLKRRSGGKDLGLS